MKGTEIQNVQAQACAAMQAKIKELEARVVEWSDRAYSEGMEEPIRAILAKLFRELKQTVFASCGLGEITILKFGDVNQFNDQYVMEQLCERSGIGLIVQDERTLKVDLKSEGKNVTMSNDEVLDFAQLMRENRARNELWKECVPRVAKECAAKLETYLNSMENLVFGVPDILILRRFSEIRRCCGEFNFVCNVKIRYADLTPSQAMNVITEMNRHIRGGKITLQREATETMYPCTIEIERTPTKIKECWLDYEAFCKTYEEMTPRLEKILTQIVDGLELLSPETQYKTLVAKRQLVFWFRDEEFSFRSMKHNLSEWVKRQLFARIEEKYPGIKVVGLSFANEEKYWSSPRGCTHGMVSAQERVEFECEVVDGTHCQFAASMLQVEAKIEAIKAKYDIFSQKIIDIILAKTERQLYDARQWDEEEGGYDMAEYTLSMLLKDVQELPEGALQAVIEDQPIDLTTVKDKTYIRQIEDDILEKSGMMIRVNLTNGVYNLSW